MDIPAWWNNKFWQNIDKSVNVKRKNDSDIATIDVRNTRKLLENRPSTPSDKAQIGTTKNNVNAQISYPFKITNDLQRLKSADWGKSYANSEGKSCMIPLSGKAINPKIRLNSSAPCKTQLSGKNRPLGSLRVSYTSRPVSATFRPDFNVPFQNTMMILGQNPFHQKTQIRSSTENLSNLKKKSLSFSSNSLESIYTAPTSEKSITIESDRTANRPKSLVNNKRIKSASSNNGQKKISFNISSDSSNGTFNKLSENNEASNDPSIGKINPITYDEKEMHNPQGNNYDNLETKDDSQLPIGAEFKNISAPSVVETCSTQIDSPLRIDNSDERASSEHLEASEKSMQKPIDSKPHIAWENESKTIEESSSINKVSNLQEQEIAIKNLHSNINSKLNGLEMALERETRLINERNNKSAEHAINTGNNFVLQKPSKLETIEIDSNDSCSPRDKIVDEKVDEIEVIHTKDSNINRINDFNSVKMDKYNEFSDNNFDDKPVLFVPKSVILKNNIKLSSIKGKNDNNVNSNVESDESTEKMPINIKPSLMPNGRNLPIKSILKRNIINHEIQSGLHRLNTCRTGRLADSVWKEIFKVEGYTVDLNSTEINRDDTDHNKSSSRNSIRPYTANPMRKTSGSSVPLRTSLSSPVTNMNEKRQGVRFDMRSNSVMEFHPTDIIKTSLKLSK